MSTNKQTFEQQINALETIVEKLEKGELSLEDSLSQFEKGIKLTKDCQVMLNNAQQKVAQLSRDGKNLEDFSAE